MSGCERTYILPTVNYTVFQVGFLKSLETSFKVSRDLQYLGHNSFVLKAYPFNDEQVW
jgi:hypothetical protein